MICPKCGSSHITKIIVDKEWLDEELIAAIKLRCLDCDAKGKSYRHYDLKLKNVEELWD